MKIFIYDFRTNGNIATVCHQGKFSILTAQQVRRRRSRPKNVNFFLDEVDLLILEITRPTQDSQFILAQAMLAKKPTLCLYGKNQPPRPLLHMVRERKSPTVKTFSYTFHNLPVAVTKFIAEFHPAAERHDREPSIKYTLRLSPKCDRYLDWVCRRERISKADYFRLFLEQQAVQDQQYTDPGSEHVRRQIRPVVK